MPGFEQVHAMFADCNDDLRNEVTILLAHKKRFDPVGLRANRVDQADVVAILLIAKAVDVVTARKAVTSSEGGWEYHTIQPFDGHQVFTEDDRCGTAVVKVRIELF